MPVFFRPSPFACEVQGNGTKISANLKYLQYAKCSHVQKQDRESYNTVLSVPMTGIASRAFLSGPNTVNERFGG